MQIKWFDLRSQCHQVYLDKIKLLSTNASVMHKEDSIIFTTFPVVSLYTDFIQLQYTVAELHQQDVG